MTRYEVDAETILANNYQITTLTTSNTNPTLNNTITVTATLKDVYGDTITGETINITCSSGVFTHANGTSITPTDNVTATTTSNGTVELTYSCTTPGLITFQTRNITTQAHVHGLKTITLTNGTLYVDEDNHTAELHYSYTKTFSAGDAGNWTFIETISQITNYPPKDTLYAQCSNPNMIARLFSTGSVQAHPDSQGSLSVTFNLFWHY